MKCRLLSFLLLSIFVTYNVSLRVPSRRLGLLGEKRTILKASLQDEKVYEIIIR